jgi:signal transduction histidine kinase
MEINPNLDKLQHTIEHRRDEIAERWYQEVAWKNDLPHEANHKSAQFREMTADIISLLFNHKIDPEKAQVLGTSLAVLTDIQPEILGKSQKILTLLLLENLSTDEYKFIQPKLTILLSELTTGYVKQVHSAILEQQEDIRTALRSDIQNANKALQDLTERLERRIEHQSALLTLSQSLLGETDKEKLFKKATDALSGLFEADFCEILLLNDHCEALRYAAGCGWESDTVRDLGIPVESNTLASYTLDTKQPVIVEDISSETRFTPSKYYLSHGIVSSLSAPMKLQNRLVGVISIHWDHPHEVRDSEIRLLPLIANTTSAALEGVRLFEDVQNRIQSITRANELITALNKTGTRLAITMDPDQVMDTVRTELKTIGLHCAAFLYEEKKLEISHLYSAHEQKVLEQTKVNTGIDLHDPMLQKQLLKKFYRDTLHTKTSKFIEQRIIDQIIEPTHPEKSKIERALTQVGLSPETPSMWLPLIVKSHVIGTLGLWGKGLEQEDLPAVKVFASQVATAIENAKLFDQIVLSRTRMRHLSNKLVQIQEIERRRIARELHDEIGQSLTGLSLMLNSLFSPDEGRSKQFEKTQKLVEELIAKTQNLSLDLRPAMLDEMGVLPTLLWFFHRYENQTGIHINFEHRGLNRRFSSPLETTIYRIIQEALTNIARHAGVEHATARVWTDQESVSIQIEDQGIGFDLDEIDDQATANGLIGMKERATLLGGDFEISTAPGSGTTLFASIPIHYEDEGEINDL